MLDFSHARGVALAPLGLGEIPVAALWYPVVFSFERRLPMAVTGLRKGENLFVDDAGGWREGAYVPADIRRYPFMLAEDGEALTLCVDHCREVLREGGRALFEGERPTALTHAALDFCHAVLAEQVAGEGFVEALLSRGLLVGRRPSVTNVPRESALGILHVVDEAAVEALPTEVKAVWREAGWLAPLHAVIQSTANWTRLARILDERKVACRGR